MNKMIYSITAAVLSVASLNANAEIYKCNVDGRVVYQQIPCENGTVVAIQKDKFPVESGEIGLRAGEVSLLNQLENERHSLEQGRAAERQAAINESNRQEALNIERRKAQAMENMAIQGAHRHW